MPRKASEKLKELTKNNSIETTSKPAKTTNSNNHTGLTNIDPTSYKKEVEVKGLAGLNPYKLDDQLPKFDFNQHKVTDPLNPPDSEGLRQSDADREKAKRIYQERKNGWESVKDSFADSGYRFDAMGARADAVGKGIRAATKEDKAKGNLLDFLKTQEDNKQKYVNLRESQYKTGIVVQQAVFTQQELDSGLQQAQNKAEKATLDAQKSLTELEEFRKQLGESKSK